MLPESLPQRMKNARAGWEARSSVSHDLLAHTLLLFIFQRGTLIPVLAAPWCSCSLAKPPLLALQTMAPPCGL